MATKSGGEMRNNLSSRDECGRAAAGLERRLAEGEARNDQNVPSLPKPVPEWRGLRPSRPACERLTGPNRVRFSKIFDSRTHHPPTTQPPPPRAINKLHRIGFDCV